MGWGETGSQESVHSLSHQATPGSMALPRKGKRGSGCAMGRVVSCSAKDISVLSCEMR